MADIRDCIPASKRAFLPYYDGDKHCEQFVLEILTKIVEECGYEYVIEVRDSQPGLSKRDSYCKFLEECPFVIIPLCKTFLDELLPITRTQILKDKVLFVQIEDINIPSSLKEFQSINYCRSAARIYLKDRIKKCLDVTIGTPESAARPAADASIERTETPNKKNKIQYVRLSDPSTNAQQGTLVMTRLLDPPVGELKYIRYFYMVTVRDTHFFLSCHIRY